MTAPTELQQQSVMRRGAQLVMRFMRSHPIPTVISIVGAVAFAAAAVGATMVTGWVTDTVIKPAFNEGVTTRTIWGGVAALIAVGFARGISVVVRRYYAAMLEARMQVTLRTGVVDKYLEVPLSWHQARPTGELLAHADADVTGTTMLIKPLPFSIGLIALVVFALGSLVAVDWTFTVIALALFPMLAVLNRYYTSRVELPSARVQRRMGDVSSVAHESFDGALIIKTLGLEQFEADRFNGAAGRLREERLIVGRLRATFEPIIDVLPNLGAIGLLLVGAWRIDAGAISAGDLVQAMLLFSILAFPMRVFGFFLEEVPRAVVSVERVDSVLDSDSHVSNIQHVGSEELPEGPIGLEFDDVWFSYDDDSVLSGVSFDVAPGETVALVGSTGSGKSTVNLLAVRLLEAARGEVRVGGAPVSALDPEQLRGAVALVFQESFLFAASVRDNVALDADPPIELSDSEFAQIATTAQVDRFIDDLPAGWETELGERGVTLSGGQRQRVALARALARRPRVLLLDDSTSAVDPTIEAEILGRLRDESATLLIVAHRLSTIALADRVVFLDDGKVAATGTHAELLEHPSYAALVHAYEAEEVAS